MASWQTGWRCFTSACAMALLLLPATHLSAQTAPDLPAPSPAEATSPAQPGPAKPDTEPNATQPAASATDAKEGNTTGEVSEVSPANTPPASEPTSDNSDVENPTVESPAEVTADADSAFTSKLSTELIQSRLTNLKTDETLTEEGRAALNDAYQKILNELGTTQILQRNRADFAAKTAAIPEQVEQFKAGNAGGEEPTDDIADPADQAAGLSQQQLDERVRNLQTRLQAAQETLKNRTPQRKQRDDRRLKVPTLSASLADARTKLEKLRAAPSDPDESAMMREARTLLVEAKLANNQLESQLLQDELTYYDRSSELLNLQIEAAEDEVASLTLKLKEWTQLAEETRSREAQRDVKEKEDIASHVPEPLRPLANANVKYSEELKTLADDISSTASTATVTRDRLNRWNDQFNRIRDLIDAHAGVTESVGNLLRDQRIELPDVGELERLVSERRNLIYEVRSAEFTIGEERRRLDDMDRYVARELLKIRKQQRQADPLAANQPAPAKDLAPQIRSLLEGRESTVDALRANYQAYLETLVNLNVEQDRLRLLSKRYSNFIDERVLWIRSVPPVTWRDFVALPNALSGLGNIELWSSFLPHNLQLTSYSVIIHFVVGVFVVACFFVRRWGFARIAELGGRASARGCREFGITIGVLLWTVLISVTGPAVLAWLGWMIGDLTDPSRSANVMPLQKALYAAALIYWPLSLWWNLTREAGLARAHFDWSESFLLRLRQQLRWLTLSLVPTGAFYYFFSSHQNLSWDMSVARFALVFAASCLAVWCHSLLSPRRGVLREYFSYRSTGWLYRLRYIWFPAVVALPVLLAALALMGYQYTAQRLIECLFMSTVFLSTLYLLGAIALRWILINRRRLAMAQAREKLAKLSEAGEGGEFQGRADEKIDLVEIDHQTRRLLNSFAWVAAAIGVYLIWVDVLPALSRLNEVKLWQYNSVAARVLDPGNAEGVATAASDGSWVTLASLLGSLLIVAMTLIAIRNVPGLLEFAVLQNLPFDASIRFAITTVVRYVLIIAGIGWSLGNMGFGWAKLQWLAAAVSVGLGFGLQEIFANFISGLILLFERPLRAGDVVTVGDVTGTVVEIKIRATTIQDWDRKELVVPNKEFITGRLLNWTLTDEVNRIVIQVGVAYGTDIERARSLVLEAVQQHPLVLAEPGVSVTFDLFGDSALNLTMRCYLAEMRERLSTTHALHQIIYDTLNDAGVEIPFPQRDVRMIEA